MWALSSIGRVAAAALAAAALVPMGEVVAQSDVVGVWNMQSRDMTDRAAGGIRMVLLRLEEGGGGGFEADITAITNRFMPVQELDVDGNAVRVVFGSYEYDLTVDGNEISGTVVSPLGTQSVTGFKQRRGMLYVGDVSDPFIASRSGLLGLASGPLPPNGYPDPAGWVKARANSVDDLALIVGRARIPITFTNGRDFEDDLMGLAGQDVVVVGQWVGAEITIHSIEPS